MAKDEGAVTLLNPSPPVRPRTKILPLVDYIVPNETEAQVLTGMRWRSEKEIRKMATRLLDMGVRNVVVTLGSKGLFFKNRTEEFRMKAFKVNVVDTTAAGDAFLGGLATALSENTPIRDALKFANAAGALATTKLGAQPSLPSRRELETFLAHAKEKS